MAKKSANPADAYRKALKAKELKKNKEARKAARETQTVKRDTREIEGEISKLKSQGKLNDEAKSRLEALQSELKYVNRTKEAYVKAHPEARDRVFKQHRSGPSAEEDEAGPSDPNAALYGEDGKLRDPKRSVYYDPIYNPYGVPPPGMPYKERTPEESESEDESDDDIVMPEGPPPDSDVESDDSDDIPMPAGPPPSTYTGAPLPPGLPPNVPSGPSAMIRPPTQPPPMTAWGWGEELQSTAHLSSGGPSRQIRPPTSANLPIKPTTAPTMPQASRNPAQAAVQHSLPPRPSGSATSISSAPAAATISSAPTTAPKVDYSAAAIEAAPVMRDLRKEATAFVPRGVKRKQAQAPGGVNVNSAPGRGQVDEDGDERRVVEKEEGGGLMGRLKGVIGEMGGGDSGKKKKTEGDDEYQKFLEGLEDLA